MIDRWKNRADQAPGEDVVYWHMLIGEHPEAVALARTAQQRLARFSGLHMTPLTWLHITAHIAGPASQFTPQQLTQMADTATRLLASTPPITVTLGKILYHPQAIMLAASPPEALAPLRQAALSATRQVTGTTVQPEEQAPWTPHVTVCYSTAEQPAEPIIATLGRQLPRGDIQISALSLVIQRGPERQWDWHPLATARLGTAM